MDSYFKGWRMKKIFISLIFLIPFLSGCSTFQVTSLDAKTGYFPTSTMAKLIVSKPIDLDAQKNLIVIPNNAKFEQGMLESIHYFDKVISVEDLEKEIIKAGLTKEVLSVRDAIGMHNAATHYKKFLWLHGKSDWDRRDNTVRLIITDPVTMDDLLIVENKVDAFWVGITDQNMWYPLFNGVVSYIRENSKTYNP